MTTHDKDLVLLVGTVAVAAMILVFSLGCLGSLLIPRLVAYGSRLWQTAKGLDKDDRAAPKFLALTGFFVVICSVFGAALQSISLQSTSKGDYSLELFFAALGVTIQCFGAIVWGLVVLWRHHVAPIKASSEPIHPAASLLATITWGKWLTPEELERWEASKPPPARSSTRQGDSG